MIKRILLILVFLNLGITVFGQEKLSESANFTTDLHMFEKEDIIVPFNFLKRLPVVKNLYCEPIKVSNSGNIAAEKSQFQKDMDAAMGFTGFVFFMLMEPDARLEYMKQQNSNFGNPNYLQN